MGKNHQVNWCIYKLSKISIYKCPLIVMLLSSKVGCYWWLQTGFTFYSFHICFVSSWGLRCFSIFVVLIVTAQQDLVLHFGIIFGKHNAISFFTLNFISHGTVTSRRRSMKVIYLGCKIYESWRNFTSQLFGSHRIGTLFIDSSIHALICKIFSALVLL